MPKLIVVAEYRTEPAEGIQVVSRALVDAVRGAGYEVEVVEPARMPRRLPGLLASRPRIVIFTHGPGPGVVLYSFLLRILTRSRIVWVATRPDLARAPKLLRGRRTAHVVVCNRRRRDLDAFALGARFVQQFIGIDPSRLGSTAEGVDPWPELRAGGVPIALHVGHLRRNRGLDALAEAKRKLGDRVEIVVQGSPTFEPDDDVVRDLVGSGVHVRRDYEKHLRRLYDASDLYLFPVGDDAGGAVELPLGVLEAVACQVPVMTTRFGVLAEALAGVDGVRFASVDSYVEELCELITTGDFRARPAGLPDQLHAARTAEAVLREMVSG